MATTRYGPDSHASSQRNLKVLVVLLLVSNIFVGALSAYHLRAVDRRYSELVAHSVPVLNDLRELMSDVVMAMRTTAPRTLSGTDSDKPAALDAMRASLQKSIRFRAAMLATNNLAGEPIDSEALVKTGAAFDAAVLELVQTYSTNQWADGIKLREEKLIPAFEQHLAVIGQAADDVEAKSLGVSKDYTSRTNTLTKILLGVASWPIILLAGLLLVTAVFVIAMMIAFRGTDLADAP